MTVGFLFVETGDEAGRLCAEGMVRSVQRSMPGVSVCQFTDETTRRVDGVDDLRRLPMEPMGLLRFRHQASVTGDWLFLDTDVIVQQDVRRVFHQSFHVAIPTRNWKHLRRAEGFTERMPFNAGVVFSRSQGFWQEALSRLEASDTQDREFMGHQQVICDLIDTGRYQVLCVKGSKYNCPPYVPGGKEGGNKKLGAQMVREAAIVHYKGAHRKHMLIKRIRREALCA